MVHYFSKRLVCSLLVFGQMSLPVSLVAQDMSQIQNQMNSLRTEVAALQSQLTIERMTSRLTLCIVEGGTRESCGQLDDAQISALNTASKGLRDAPTGLSEVPSAAKDKLVQISTNLADAFDACGQGEETCDAPKIEELTAQLGIATDEARKVCAELPVEARKPCLQQVDEFAEQVPEDLQRIVEILGPVIAVCAASLGVGCALMALLAIAQLFGDSGGNGGSGEEGTGGEQASTGGEKGDEETETPDAKVARQGAEGRGWNYQANVNSLLLTRVSDDVSFQVPGWLNAPAREVKSGISPQAAAVAPLFNDTTVSAWLDANPGVSQFFVDESKEPFGVAVCTVASGPVARDDNEVVEWYVFRADLSNPQILIVDTKQASCPVERLPAAE